MQGQYRPRTRGSARFSPYYKVQYFDGVSMAWRDLPSTHPTAEQAAAAYVRDAAARVTEITEHGRSPLPEAV